MSFLEKEEEKEGGSFWDWVVGIGLIVLIGGFTFYYQYQKRSSISRFKQADSLYTAGKFREAAREYEELKNAQILTTQDDSTIYARLDTIEMAGEQVAARVQDSKAKLQAGDTASARSLVTELRFKELLSPEDQAWVDSMNGNPPAVPSAAAPSAAP